MLQPPAPALAARAINLIVLHCSATPSGQKLAANGPPTVVIDRWHAARGFARTAAARLAFNPELAAIGYHYVVDVDGRVWTGRHLNEVGAHAYGHNANSVGVCMVGGAERDGRYTPAAWRALAQLVLELAKQLSVPLRFAPVVGVCGHRDLSPDTNGDGKVAPAEWLKTCPGFDVAAWLGADMTPPDRNVLPEVAP